MTLPRGMAHGFSRIGKKCGETLDIYSAKGLRLFLMITAIGCIT
jgi:hypothetical protein